MLLAILALAHLNVSFWKNSTLLVLLEKLLVSINLPTGNIILSPSVQLFTLFLFLIIVLNFNSLINPFSLVGVLLTSVVLNSIFSILAVELDEGIKLLKGN